LLLFLLAGLFGERRILNAFFQLLQFLVVGIDNLLARRGITLEFLQRPLPGHATLDDLLLIHHRDLDTFRGLSRVHAPDQHHLRDHGDDPITSVHAIPLMDTFC
jgi:hypothetical protein